MFDIGWGEFVVIAVVALIVIGPKELPAVLRAIGQWTTKIRRMASEFQSQFQEALREAEMADLKKEVDSLNDTARGFTSQFDDPLNFKEATKWEPSSEAAKTESANPDPDKPDGAPKPADTPPQPELVTPDGYAVPVSDTPAIEKIPVSADQPAVEQALPPSAAEATPAPQPSVAEGSGQKGEGGARS